MSHDWIQTYTGKKFFPLSPNEADISIEDIAHALSNICRFNGQTVFYSVAQHSVLVSKVCDPKDRMWGLLHDASEGLGLADLVTPVKKAKSMAGYRRAENKLMLAVCKRFGLPTGYEPNIIIDSLYSLSGSARIKMPPSVARADHIVFATEVEDLIIHKHPDWDVKEALLEDIIEPVPPLKAKEMFLERYYELALAGVAL